MTLKDAVKLINDAGTRIGKDKLLETIRKAPAKDFDFLRESNQNFLIVKIKV